MEEKPKANKGRLPLPTCPWNFGMKLGTKMESNMRGPSGPRLQKPCFQKTRPSSEKVSDSESELRLILNRMERKLNLTEPALPNFDCVWLRS